MLRRVAWLGLSLATACTTVGRIRDDDGRRREPRPDRELAEWTLMMFMNGDNDLEYSICADFVEMGYVGSTDRVHIVAQLDRSKGENHGWGDWHDTRRFRIEKEMRPETKHTLPGQALGEVNMCDGKSLREFVEWAMENYPAKRYMLDIESHGSGWRGAVYAEGVGGIYGGHRAITSDSDRKKSDLLYNREIQEALAPLKGRIDLIGFDACLTGGVETGYALRDLGTVMVASADVEPAGGWQYDAWLPKLIAKPAMEAEELAKVIVDSYRDNGGDTLAASRLGTFEPLARAITEMANRLLEVLDDQFETIKAVRGPGSGYDRTHAIDLGGFCSALAAQTSDAILRQRAHAVRKALHVSVRHNYSWDGSEGISIYFPKSASAYARDPGRDGYRQDNRTYPIEFVQNHRWDEFLHAYFELVD